MPRALLLGDHATDPLSEEDAYKAEAFTSSLIAVFDAAGEELKPTVMVSFIVSAMAGLVDAKTNWAFTKANVDEYLPEAIARQLEH